MSELIRSAWLGFYTRKYEVWFLQSNLEDDTEANNDLSGARLQIIKTDQKQLEGSQRLHEELFFWNGQKQKIYFQRGTGWWITWYITFLLVLSQITTDFVI